MESSNLALRLDFDEPRAAKPATETGESGSGTGAEPAGQRPRRPRRSLEFRWIVLHDQGFAPFRVR